MRRFSLPGSPPAGRLAAFIAALAVAALASCGPSNQGAASYRVVFTLSETPDDVDLATLSFLVEYQGGSIVGEGSDVSCEQIADDEATAQFSDDDEGELQVAIDATESLLASGTDIVRCSFLADVQPGAGNFAVTVVAATAEPEDEGEEGEDLDPDEVLVIVSSVVPEN